MGRMPWYFKIISYDKASITVKPRLIWVLWIKLKYLIRLIIFKIYAFILIKMQNVWDEI